MSGLLLVYRRKTFLKIFLIYRSWCYGFYHVDVKYSSTSSQRCFYCKADGRLFRKVIHLALRLHRISNHHLDASSFRCILPVLFPQEDPIPHCQYQGMHKTICEYRGSLGVAWKEGSHRWLPYVACPGRKYSKRIFHFCWFHRCGTSTLPCQGIRQKQRDLPSASSLQASLSRHPKESLLCHRTGINFCKSKLVFSKSVFFRPFGLQS